MNDRIQGIFGVVSAIGFVVGVLLVSSIPVGGEAAADAEIREFYQASADRTRVIVGLYILVLSVACFVPLLSALYVRAGAAEASDGSHSMAALIFGTAFVALAIAGAAALASVAGAIELGGEPADLPDTGVARFMGHLGYALLLIGGGIAAAGMMFAFSWVGLKHRWLPTWAVWLGFGAAVLMLLAIIFIPVIALPIWMLAVSFLLLRGRLDSAPH